MNPTDVPFAIAEFMIFFPWIVNEFCICMVKQLVSMCQLRARIIKVGASKKLCMPTIGASFLMLLMDDNIVLVNTFVMGGSCVNYGKARSP